MLVYLNILHRLPGGGFHFRVEQKQHYVTSRMLPFLSEYACRNVNGIHPVKHTHTDWNLPCAVNDLQILFEEVECNAIRGRGGEQERKREIKL